MVELVGQVGQSLEGLNLIDGSSPRRSLEYHALPTKRHFRLLDLKPSALNSIHSLSLEVVTTIDVYDLDNAPRFNALSYTWGDAFKDPLSPSNSSPDHPPTFESQMTCNGQQVSITRNLYDGLSAFVKAGISGLIWVDAICINQKDDVEKGSQVAMMGDIYSRASEVLIWLGPHRDGIEDFAYATTDLLETVASQSHPRQLKQTFRSSSLFDLEFWDSIQMESPLRRLVGFALFYASCRWFTRCWILQEVALAQKSRMICGTLTISVRAAIDVAMILLHETHWFSEVENFVRKSFDLRRFFWIRELAALFFFDLIDVSQDSFDELHHRWDADAASILALSRLLANFRTSNCVDPRDKIYSLLGIVNGQALSPSIYDFITPDYTLFTEDVLTKTSTTILEKSHTLDALCELRSPSEDSSSLNLPSWVVDYTVAEGPVPLASPRFFDFDPRFDASSCEKTVYPPFSVQKSQIQCSGAKFDVIIKTMTCDMVELGTQIELQQDALLSLWSFFLSLPPMTNGLPRLAVLGQTLGCFMENKIEWDDLDAYAKKIKPWMTVMLMWLMTSSSEAECQHADLRGILETLSRSPSSHERDICQKAVSQLEWNGEVNVAEDVQYEVLNAERDRCIDLAIEMDYHRRLFLTENGHLGMGSRTVKAGDQVWMLCDAHVPFVLRPDASEGQYQVLGDCYVHCFMNGEMLEDPWGLKDKIGPLTIV